MMKLYETYENCQDEVGRILYDKDGGGKTPLLPIAHTTQNAHVEVTLDEDGAFLSAKALGKGEGVTIIPCTEGSASRSGKAPVNHPIFDKLQYLAGDYAKFGGEKGETFHENYMAQLERWCESSYANEKVKIILKYLRESVLIGDLVRSGVLFCSEDGKLLNKWNGEKENTPVIFRSITGSQSDAFVRIKVNIPGDLTPELWKDREVYNDFIQYYLSSMEAKQLCFVSGEMIPCSDMHPSKIRNTADKAKLISANDSVGFTFRGRFTAKEQVASVGYDVSQKAHNALKWLIEKQGYKLDDKVFLAWGTKNEQIPPVLSGSNEIAGVDDEEDDDDCALVKSVNGDKGDLTQEAFAKRLNKALYGFYSNLDHNSQIIIMGLDAATTGRLSITFYREMPGDQFLQRIESWHLGCSWKHDYGFDDNKERRSFTGAPSPKDIDFAAYGERNEKLRKITIERILHCIVDGVNVPEDIVQSAVRRASNPVAMERWKWNKTLTIACALYRRRHQKEELTMALDEKRQDRSYLYGRLLAVADQVENLTYSKWGERESNAMRYMNTFSQKPYRTWQIIEGNLQPYYAQLKTGSKNYYRDLRNQIGSLFDAGDFENDKPLEGLYLHGYYCQMQLFRDSAKDYLASKKNNEAEETITE